jgi:hypothetical protein
MTPFRKVTPVKAWSWVKRPGLARIQAPSSSTVRGGSGVRASS